MNHGTALRNRMLHCSLQVLKLFQGRVQRIGQSGRVVGAGLLPSGYGGPCGPKRQGGFNGVWPRGLIRVVFSLGFHPPTFPKGNDARAATQLQ